MTSQPKIDAVAMSLVGLLDGLTVGAAHDALAEAKRIIHCGSTVNAVAARDARAREVAREIEEEEGRDRAMSVMIDDPARPE